MSLLLLRPHGSCRGRSLPEPPLREAQLCPPPHPQAPICHRYCGGHWSSKHVTGAGSSVDKGLLGDTWEVGWDGAMSPCPQVYPALTTEGGKVPHWGWHLP